MAYIAGMNSFGRIFRISIFGESHGKSIGVVVDGCPPGVEIKEDDFLFDLARRKSGAKGTTPRIEPDMPEIISGVFDGKSTGAPMAIVFENTDVRSKDYSVIKNIPRPGHADFTAGKKYGYYNDYRGSGHFSGRLTLAIVAAGVIAKKIIEPIKVNATILQIGKHKDIETGLKEAIKMNDSIGGLLECRVGNMPIGLGEPFFDSLESQLAHMIFSIPAIKGIEFGAGFQSVEKYGSEMNDAIIAANGKTNTNFSGGINGGLSNGNELIFRIVVKPTSSIALSQETFNMKKKKMDKLIIEGRHDLCIALRVPPVLEAATAIVLADQYLIKRCF